MKVMLIDINRCNDCNNCFMACKDEFCDSSAVSVSQPKHGHRWMNILRRERGQYPMIDMAFMPMPCQQCSDPECAKFCSGINKQPDGVVALDCEKSKGCRDAVTACPYGAVYYNEQADCPQKCDFCRHLTEKGESPRCVDACPTGALNFVELSDAEYDKLLEDGWKIYGSDKRPGVLYKGLDRYEKHFIGGSVIKNNDCLEGAKVSLMQGVNTLDTKLTNGFGDFKFDFLDKGEYTVIIENDGKKKEISISIDDAKSLGVIFL